MNDATIIIVVHQLLFQGVFFANNALLRRKLGQSIRGANTEANLSIAFFIMFIGMALAIAISDTEWGRVALLPDAAATGICLMALAVNMAIAIASLRDLGDSWRVGVIDEQETTLVQDGIYRFTRNPYFASYLFMFAAYTLLLQNLILAVMSIVGTTMVHWMIKREERYLLLVHGERYRDYYRRTPRYLLIRDGL